MSHFYADIQGNRGEATRGGTKGSGISGHVRGWSTGGRVECYYDDESDRDIVRMFKTGGSNHRSNGELVAEFCDKQGVLAEHLCDHCNNRFKCFTERYGK
jgi:hypothetical protein